MVATILFVYNADGGAVNWLLDVGHKIVSPETYSCHLCQLSHGYLSAHKPWKAFVAELQSSYHLCFLHRDEYLKDESLPHYPTPTILLQDADSIRCLLSNEDIQGCDTLETLLHLIRQRLADAQG